LCSFLFGKIFQYSEKADALRFSSNYAYHPYFDVCLCLRQLRHHHEDESHGGAVSVSADFGSVFNIPFQKSFKSVASQDCIFQILLSLSSNIQHPTSTSLEKTHPHYHRPSFTRQASR